VLPDTTREVDVPRAVVAVILRETADGRDHELLFIKRSDDPADPWSGHIAFPGGRVEPADVDVLATARRETLEEVALDLEREGVVLGRLPDIQPVFRSLRTNLVVSALAFGVGGDAVARAQDEVASVHWWRLAELADPARTGQMFFQHEGLSIEAPCIRIDGQTIWGLTFRMLRDLLSVLAAF
jgi:8-oxo-dGTP pyrophosphatase MutT (NUDIX family)